MSSINFATKEISVKIVFYGPGLCGKTTTLQAIYQSIRPEKRPQMVSLATDVDRTIFFDFLPVNAYKIGDFVVRLQLYTVPGQVFYNSTRKLVLNGVDGVVFVVDSQRAALDDNRESFYNLAENLKELGMAITRVPYVLQYNKRDLTASLSIEELNREINPNGVLHFPTVATTGEGVQETLKGISRLVIQDLTSKGVGKRVLFPSESTPLSRPEPSVVANNAAANLEAALASSAPPAAAPVVTTTSGSGKIQPVAARAALSFSALWPTQPLRTRCREVESAITKGDYRDAVLSAWGLCTEATTGGDEKDMALEVLLRGVPGPRFLRFRELVQRARTGESITLSDALFVLHIAAELVV